LKENKFVESLNDLFDVAHEDALTMIKIDDDRQFLIAQRRKGRPGAMMGYDKKLENIEKRKRKRTEAFEEQEQREKKRRSESINTSLKQKPTTMMTQIAVKQIV
jgi:hypothetical protein